MCCATHLIRETLRQGTPRVGAPTTIPLVLAVLVHEFRSRFVEGTLEGRAVMVLDPSLNQSELCKGAASTFDFIISIICLLSRIEGPLKRAFTKITINECASVLLSYICIRQDTHTLAMASIVIPLAIVGASVSVLDPGGPMNDAGYKTANALAAEPNIVILFFSMDDNLDETVQRGTGKETTKRVGSGESAGRIEEGEVGEGMGPQGRKRYKTTYLRQKN